ncbi:MAG: hypothetical protein QXP36_07570 [Conexivisphaerales archaeon]
MEIEWTDLEKDTEEESVKREKEKELENEENEWEESEAEEKESEEKEEKKELISGGLGELIISLGNVIYRSQGLDGYNEYEEQKIREFADSVEEKRHIKIPSEVGLGVYALSPLFRKLASDIKARNEKRYGGAVV